MKKPTQHTPGPWRRDESGFIVAGIGDTYVAVAVADCSDTDIDEREANKSLIIAAPELLDALDACENWLGEFGADSPDTGLCGLVEQARAAITKAAGGMAKPITRVPETCPDCGAGDSPMLTAVDVTHYNGQSFEFSHAYDESKREQADLQAQPVRCYCAQCGYYLPVSEALADELIHDATH